VVVREETPNHKSRRRGEPEPVRMRDGRLFEEYADALAADFVANLNAKVRAEGRLTVAGNERQ
jgi:hypothetical protein